MGVHDYAPVDDAGVYNYGKRARKDVGWGLLFGAVVAAVGGLGAYAASHRNVDYQYLTAQSYLADLGNCPVTPADEVASGRYGHGLSERAASGEVEDLDEATFLKHAKFWLVVSVLGAGALGLAFVGLFKSHAGQVVRFVCGLKVAVPFMVGMTLFVQGATVPALVMFALAAMMLFVFYLWRRELELCSRLLAVSAHGLKENGGLVPTVLGIKTALLAVIVPHVAFVVLAVMNGDVARNEDAQHKAPSGSTLGCVDDEGKEVSCCVWEVDSWVGPYMLLALFSLMWCCFLAFDLRLYTVAGSITQWYFAPAGETAGRNTTLAALRNGLGASFGSLCLGSLVLTAIEIMRKINDQARRNSSREGGAAAIIGCLIASVVECIYTVIEFLSKFAVIQMAISGESFCDAAKTVTELLKRNFMSAYSVWWVPPMVLHTAAFIIAGAWGVLAGVLSGMTSFHGDVQSSNEAVLLGVVAFVMAWIVLSFFCALLLNIVDAVFLCYAIDRDRQVVSLAEVHEVFACVPTVGPCVVQQPDGDLAYAPPNAPPAPHA